ncbi:hypothetical protein PANNVG_03232 [Pantoea sp. Nvir]
MFYQGVILRLSFWIILLRKAWLALCRQGKGRSGPRSLLLLSPGCCLFARAHSVAIRAAGRLTLFFY